MRIFVAGLLYFALAFAAGFVLGVVRTLVLEPALAARWPGDAPLLAVAIEGPVILVVSWFAARWVVRNMTIRMRSQALALGWIAWLMLQVAELGLGFITDPSLATYRARLASSAGQLGLALQVVFAFLPLLACEPRPRTQQG